MGIDIEELYKKYGPMVLRRCRWILKEENRALDAMQDVFVQLIRYKDKLHGTYPSSLLYRIATNICLNMIRKERGRYAQMDDDMLYNIASWENLEQDISNKEELDRIFKDEKESTRVMAVMHFIDGMTFEEVASEVGLSVSGVRKRLRLLSERIRK